MCLYKCITTLGSIGYTYKLLYYGSGPGVFHHAIFLSGFLVTLFNSRKSIIFLLINSSNDKDLISNSTASLPPVNVYQNDTINIYTCISSIYIYF